MTVTNEEIAQQLAQIADLLELDEDANPFRVRAYRNAAKQVRMHERPLADLLETDGREALTEIPDIGSGLAGIITEIVHTGRASLLDQLKREIDPAKVFEQVPGIGEELSEQIAEHLDIATLEELEQAAHDGRLGQVPGFGPERVRNVQVSLAGLLSGAAQRHAQQVGKEREQAPDEPGVGLLLDIDREYREKAQQDKLRRIAPKRFNPEGEAWLPIMETDRAAWHFTVLYSNTARAHELEKTHDWVVIYYKRDGEEDQVTIVTETHGPLADKRVVRGREAACRRYYGEKG